VITQNTLSSNQFLNDFLLFFSLFIFCMNLPKRVILDTNVYEFLYQKDLNSVLNLVESNHIKIYGCKLIRDELREIPKTAKVEKKSYRNLLLNLYDKLTGKHSYPIEKIIETLAEEYWIKYKFIKGGTAKRKIFPDFLIVAIATIHRLDIVVSEDDKTMKSKKAIKAYNIVNKNNYLETPNLLSLEKLLKL
jgi:rRNA-processing protein FCF1